MRLLLINLFLAVALLLSACGDKGDRAIDDLGSSPVAGELTAEVSE